jgi:hypothetical protein
MGTTPPTPAATERRSGARRQPALGTICRLGDTARVGLVWNISSGGVSMLLNERLEPGATIQCELSSAEQGVDLPVTLRVAHVTQLRNGDYMVGGQFDRPLAAEEMRPFLAGTTARS